MEPKFWHIVIEKENVDDVDDFVHSLINRGYKHNTPGEAHRDSRSMLWEDGWVKHRYDDSDCKICIFGDSTNKIFHGCDVSELPEESKEVKGLDFNDLIFPDSPWWEEYYSEMYICSECGHREPCILEVRTFPSEGIPNSCPYISRESKWVKYIPEEEDAWFDGGGE